MKLYSKQTLSVPLAAMSESGRFVHSYIITGEKGAGKKTAAKYTAMMLLCSDVHDGRPCGVCRECRRILSGVHPDCISAKKSKKSYSVDDMRDIVTDAYTSPNDCDRKVYLITDCGGWSDAAQAAMLKVTEDPPDPVYFIFTGDDLSVFLPTLISRSMVIDITTADRDACMEYMHDTYPDRPEEELIRAADAFGGNIGRCTELLEGDEKLLDLAERVRRTAAACAVCDEYTAAAVLSGIRDRDVFRQMLGMLCAVVRDAAVMKSGAQPGSYIGCDRGSAAKLSAFPASRLIQMYDSLTYTAQLCGLNCNLDSAAAMLAGRIAGRKGHI